MRHQPSKSSHVLNIIHISSGPHQCSGRGANFIIACRGSNCSSTFRTRNNFSRHCDTVHQRVRGLLSCPVDGCKRVGDRGFKRKDNVLQHMRSVHKRDFPKVKVRFGRANEFYDGGRLG